MVLPARFPTVITLVLVFHDFPKPTQLAVSADSSGGAAMRSTTRIVLSTFLAAIAWGTSAGFIARAADVTPPSPPSGPDNPTDRVPAGSAKGRGADAAIDLGEAKGGSAEQRPGPT